MDCVVHGVTKSQTQLRDLHFHFLSLIIYVASGRKGTSSASVFSSGRWEQHQCLPHRVIVPRTQVRIHEVFRIVSGK